MMTALTILFFLGLGCVAIVIDRARAEAARLRLLIDFSEQLQLSPGITAVSRILPQFATRLFPNLEGALYISQSPAEGVKLAVAWGGAREEESLPATACNALMLGLTQVLTPGAEGTCEHLALTPEAETICVPMLSAGEPFGLLMLRAPYRTQLPPEVERMANVFTQQIALALSNLRMHETLRAAAVRDSLTGLYNRRCFAESVTVEVLAKPNTSVGVILIDVDHFKRFNDTWGHGGGDTLLQQFARLLQNVFHGEDDIVCRYGGEEFVVVLRVASLLALRHRAEQLLASVRGLTVDCDGHSVTGITASAGIAIAPYHATNIEGLIAAADRALYAAKSSGRNRVATPPPQIVADRNAAA